MAILLSMVQGLVSTPDQVGRFSGNSFVPLTDAVHRIEFYQPNFTLSKDIRVLKVWHPFENIWVYFFQSLTVLLVLKFWFSWSCNKGCPGNNA